MCAFASHHEQLIQLPYLGDLTELKVIKRVQKEIRFLTQQLKINIENDAKDAHPHTHASFLSQNSKALKIFHHHAHAEAVYREQGVDLVMTFDGTGHGEDGHHWGGEILQRQNNRWIRLTHFDPIPMLTSELMIQRPHLAWQAMNKLIDASTSLKSTSAGQWFDAMASALFFGEKEITYEAQAAIELEHLAKAPTIELEWNQISFQGDFPTKDLAFFFLSELSSRFSKGELAYLAHDGLAYLITRWMKNNQFTRIGASGGVFHNQLLLEQIKYHFLRESFELLTLKHLPPGDECIAHGQWGLTCMN